MLQFSSTGKTRFLAQRSMSEIGSEEAEDSNDEFECLPTDNRMSATIVADIDEEEYIE